MSGSVEILNYDVYAVRVLLQCLASGMAPICAWTFPG